MMRSAPTPRWVNVLSLFVALAMNPYCPLIF